MAKTLVKTAFSIARNIILVEEFSFRSSPLREATKRCVQAYLKIRLKTKIK